MTTRPLPAPDPGAATAALRAGRTVALYLLSLQAAAFARLAWSPGAERSGSALARLAVEMAAAQWVAEAVAEAFGGMGSSGWRARVRIMGGLTYAGISTLCLTAVVGTQDPRLATQVVVAFSELQPLILAGSELFSTQIAPLTNAFLLVALAALRGGAVGGAAVVGFVACAIYVVAYDHAGRVLTAYPVRHAPIFRSLTARVTRIALPLVLGLTVLFAVAPPRAAPRLDMDKLAASGRDRELIDTWHRILVLGLLGGLFVLPIARLLRHKGADTVPLELLEPETLGDEALPEVPPGEGPPQGARARVIRAYVGVLGRAVDAGFRRRVSHTPREIQGEMGVAGDVLGPLTDLFMDARYGVVEIPEDAAVRAEAAARRLEPAWRRRLRTRRPGVQ